MLYLSVNRINSANFGFAICLAILVHSLALAEGVRVDSVQKYDITDKIMVRQPPLSSAEVTSVSSASALGMAFGPNDLKSVYDNNGFAACAPGSPGHGFASQDWAQAPAHCLEISRQSYSSSASRESFKDGVFGIPEHPSVRTKPDALVKGLSDRIFLQSAQHLAASNSTILSAVLSGKIEFSIPVNFVKGFGSVDLAEEERKKVKYVVLYSEKGSTQASDSNNLYLKRPVLLASNYDDVGLVGALTSRPTIEATQSGDLINGASKKLVEVSEEAQPVSSATEVKISPRKGGLSYYLGLESPIFSGLSGKLDRAGANRPQDVKFSLFESSASILFFELKPFADQSREKTVSYGYVLPYQVSRFRVQHFLGDPSKVYTAELKSGPQQLLLSLEEKTEKLKLELNLIL